MALRNWYFGKYDKTTSRDCNYCIWVFLTALRLTLYIYNWFFILPEYFWTIRRETINNIWNINKCQLIGEINMIKISIFITLMITNVLLYLLFILPPLILILFLLCYGRGAIEEDIGLYKRFYREAYEFIILGIGEYTDRPPIEK